MEKATIYHNPECGTSRNVLGILQHAGLDVEVIHYLETPPSPAELTDLVKSMGISWRDLIRTNVAEYQSHGLDKENASDAEILQAMMDAPILINRPIVVTSKGVKLARPSEAVLDILPVPLPSPYTKEDGEIVNPL
ncbi:TPA: arsenate reductase (glutaredoxin) [Streptococcus suis]